MFVMSTFSHGWGYLIPSCVVVYRHIDIYGQPAHAAELFVLTEIFAVLGQDLNAVIVAVGDDQPALGTVTDPSAHPSCE